MSETIIRGNKLCGAQFSPCRTWRYSLWRIWDDSEANYVAWIGLNPSKADEQQDDPTIRRVLDFSRRWGYGGVYMLNLFAFRATHPEVMMGAADPIGPENDRWILEYTEAAGCTIACWGNLGRFHNRDLHVAQIRRDSPHAKTRTIGENFRCLKVTEQGCPWHPLYVPKTAKHKPFRVRDS